MINSQRHDIDASVSLIATIKSKRPDLLCNLHPLLPPIDENPPDYIVQKFTFGMLSPPPPPFLRFFNMLQDIPGLGIPMLVMNTPSSFDPSGWYAITCDLFIK